MKPFPKLPLALVAAKSPANTAPTPKPVPPVVPKPPVVAAPPSKRLFVPPPKAGNPRLPVLDDESWIEGSFICEGNDPFVVETRLTGNPTSDHQSLVNLARKKYPTGKMKQASTRIFMRSRGTPPGYSAGANLGQLFGEPGSDTESGVEIGSAWFDGAKCQIFLRNLRSRNAITVALRPSGGGQIVFSNQISATRPASELGLIVREILGQGAREIVVSLKETPK